MPGTTQTLKLLLEAGKLLSSQLELLDLLTSVLELSKRVVESESASLLLYDEKTAELYFDVALGLDPGAAEIRLPLGSGIAGSVAKNRAPKIINDARADPRWSPAVDARSGFVTRSILAAPMLNQGRLVGVLEAINKRGGDFSAADLSAFETFASSAAAAIENARLFAALKDERFKLATVFEQMADGAALTDPSGKVLLSNAAAASLLGTELADLAAGLTGMTVTPPLSALLAGGEPALDFSAVRKEPTMLVLEGRVTRAPLGDGDGRLFVFRDRTEAFRQERLKRTFLSLVSHKLRTPLSAVTGYADLLSGGLKADADPATAKAVRVIQAQSGKLSELVDKLLSYTTIESPDAVIDPAPFALDAAVAEALDALQEKIGERAARVDAPATGLILRGDKRLVVEALKNLVDNAIKFDAKSAPRVALSAESEGGWAAVTVADTGPGVPPEDLERVFSRFHQVEDDFTGQKDGMGLGLAFVRKVAELHGGSAVLRSKLGAGTAVTLTLPLERSA